MLTGGASAFWFFLPLAGAILIGYLVYRALADRAGDSATEEEARIIQELHQGFTKLERRIEALETLLLDETYREEPYKGDSHDE